MCVCACVLHLKDKGCSIPLYVDGFWLLQISLLIRISNRGEQQQPAAITKTQTSPYRDLKEQISKLLQRDFFFFFVLTSRNEKKHKR